MDPVEVVKRWPYSRWRRYRAYYSWYRRNEYRLHGFNVDPKAEDDGKPRFWIEQGDGSDPFAGKTWDTETAQVPR